MVVRHGFVNLLLTVVVCNVQYYINNISARLRVMGSSRRLYTMLVDKINGKRHHGVETSKLFHMYPTLPDHDVIVNPQIPLLVSCVCCFYAVM